MKAVICDLCPKRCRIENGQSGDCRVRVNIEGKLHAVTYGHPSAVHVDPVEKKPLNHFLPGTSIFSIATVGCNLHCQNCQNWQISQTNPERAVASPLPPREVVDAARRRGCQSVAYTYTDPVVYYEYTFDTSVLAREKGLRNVLVTAGYINEAPLRELCRVTDAANIDLKFIRDDRYREICSASLKPVQEALVLSKSLGVHVEVTHLLIPTLNDSDADLTALCRWIRGNLGPETPLHFSRFFPQYRMQHLVPTPAKTLERARDIARSEGLRYIYIGNITAQDGGTTFCHPCGAAVVKRVGYEVVSNRLRNGRCPDCGAEVYGVWK